MPVELFGGTEFGHVGESHYQLTLGPYGFYWFSLESQRSDGHPVFHDGRDLPSLSTASDWRQLFRGRNRAAVAATLPDFLHHNRWFAGKARSVRSVDIDDAIPVAAGRGKPGAFIVLCHIDYAEGEPETYVLPLSVVPEAAADQILGDHPNAGVAWIDVRASADRLLLFDALVDTTFMEATLNALRRRRSFRGPSGAELRPSLTPWFRRAITGADDLSVQLVGTEQSNSSAIFGNRVVMKTFRRAQEGVNPDLEIGRYLTQEVGFRHSPPLLGALELHKGRAEPRTLAVLSGYVPNEGDAWHYTLDQLGLFYETALRSIPDEQLDAPSWTALLQSLGTMPTDVVADAIGPYLDSAELLGRRTAQLHQALAAGEDEAFSPEPFSTLYQRSLFQSMRGQVRPTMVMIRRALPNLDPAARADGEAILAAEAEILERFTRLRQHRIGAHRIRIHGDYHLGQVLHAGRDFVIIDFEGEPSRSPTERRIKRSPLVDVAGMLRSFQYAVAAGVRAYEDRGLLQAHQREGMLARGEAWQMWVTVRFLTGYLEEAGDAVFVPKDPEDMTTLLTAYTLEKSLYEVRYDLSYRPDWAAIPLHGVVQVLEQLAPPPS